MGLNLRKPGLTGQIIVGMVLGVVIGSLLKGVADYGFVKDLLLGGILLVIAKVFVISLKMLVVPLVFISLVSGTSSLGDPKKLGRVGGKTLVLYLATTAIAVTLALLAGLLIGPGRGFNRPTDATFEAVPGPSLSEVLINIFPDNPIKAMADGNMLQIIVFAVLFGIALSLVGKKGESVKRLFEDLNEVIMRMVGLLMLLAPYGVFALLVRVFAEQGFAAIVPLAKYFFVVLGVLLFHAFGVYATLLKVFGRLSPLVFFHKFKPVMLFAFSTSSSNATLPVTLTTVEKRLGVDNSIASFTIPLGATVNMDGTAIMQGVATVFIAQAYGIDLTIANLLQVVLTATLASVGTAGVPGVGLITLAMVLQQVGLPVQGIGLIIGVDRLLDMVRTAVNVTGDAAVSCIVAESEAQLDRTVFDDLQAGCEAQEHAVRGGS